MKIPLNGSSLGRTVLYIDMAERQYVAIISGIEDAGRGIVQLHVLMPAGTGIRVVQHVRYAAESREDTWRHLPQ